MTAERTVEWAEGERVTVLEYRIATPLVVMAHGAGTNQRHPMVSGIASALAGAGHGVVTFDYPYAEAGRRAPDRAPKLLACHRAVAEASARWVGEAPILAGRSMGGRMATMLASDGFQVAGVVCLAYPLHPAGKPDRLRIDHLASIPAPLLFFQGTRDALSRSDLFDQHIRPLANATVVDMEGADHSFKGRNWSTERVESTVAAEFEAWLRTIA